MPARKSTKYATNPFLRALVTESETTTKRITSPVDKNNDLLVVNGSDGSIQANASAALCMRHTVEKNEFVKLYTKGVGAMFGLKRAGQKVFGLLFEGMAGKKGVQQDTVTLYYPSLDEETKKEISYRTFTNGINDLIRQDFIAETLIPHQYFINPCFLFNGDRLAIINLYKIKAGGEPTIHEYMLDEGGGENESDARGDTGGQSDRSI